MFSGFLIKCFKVFDNPIDIESRDWEKEMGKASKTKVRALYLSKILIQTLCFVLFCVCFLVWFLSWEAINPLVNEDTFFLTVPLFVIGLCYYFYLSLYAVYDYSKDYSVEQIARVFERFKSSYSEYRKKPEDLKSLLIEQGKLVKEINGLYPKFVKRLSELFNNLGWDHELGELEKYIFEEHTINWIIDENQRRSGYIDIVQQQRPLLNELEAMGLGDSFRWCEGFTVNNPEIALFLANSSFIRKHKTEEIGGLISTSSLDATDAANEIFGYCCWLQAQTEFSLKKHEVFLRDWTNLKKLYKTRDFLSIPNSSHHEEPITYDDLFDYEAGSIDYTSYVFKSGHIVTNLHYTKSAEEENKIRDEGDLLFNKLIQAN